MDELLLHTCCGPCATVPLLELTRDYRITAWFGNSNIQPQTEYQQRLSALKSLAEGSQVPVLEDCYAPDDWLQEVRFAGGVFALIDGDEKYDENRIARQRRCRACYRFRFKMLAQTAKAIGLEHISTTLSISPYQFPEIIAMELEQAASINGLQAVYIDFRPQFRQSQRLAQELGLYRQNYCGCGYSRQEAELERQARRAARKAQRENS
ncbi:MAG: epoxyqueuosine reductase QueH [Coriobacteriales bacterium]|jgi:predicted adenine nucleotide alpha hydrolase (AANH) superfamily ATPase|nr:epoxyqueuosine reductase QueH [Coriobacteriales bacterium]